MFGWNWVGKAMMATFWNWRCPNFQPQLTQHDSIAPQIADLMASLQFRKMPRRLLLYISGGPGIQHTWVLGSLKPWNMMTLYMKLYENPVVKGIINCQDYIIPIHIVVANQSLYYRIPFMDAMVHQTSLLSMPCSQPWDAPCRGNPTN